jgi:hypothetical protein
MKLKEAMKIMDDGWMRRVKGYRIRFQKQVNGEWVADYFPDEKQKPLSSEVSAWELARRFATSKPPNRQEPGGGEVANIYVVDDLGNPVTFYGTNELRVFNPREIE